MTGRNPDPHTDARSFDGDDPTWAIAATQPSEPSEHAGEPSRERSAAFFPRVPASFRDAGLSDSQIEALVFKFLLNCGTAAGREIAEQIAMPFGCMEVLLQRLKAHQLVAYRSGAPVGDYVYELTPQGAERARRFLRQSTYFGAAPVPLEAYIPSVEAQSSQNQKPSLAAVREALADLVLCDEMLGQLGEGISAGRGFFLYGEPGNGKTSIAERVTNAYEPSIWIPRAISAAGEIIRFYDPTKHEVLSPESDHYDKHEIDKRWVRVRRPTLVVGGELRMENLEVTSNSVTGINEAPLQLKANCGTLVIDDFGRQRFNPEELLNRLIVPLEKRVDFLNLPSGRTFQIPFDSMVVFSTNLDPLSLVDEAFLRRIPYKIDVDDPTEQQFREVFHQVTHRMGVSCSEDSLDYLIRRHYRERQRKMRFCHPRDLLEQIKTSCEFRGEPLTVTSENIDAAVKNYLMLQSKAGQA